MVGDASGSTGSTTRVELYSIEKGAILLMFSSFRIRFILFGSGGGWCPPPRSNDDSWMMMSLVVVVGRVVILRIIIIVVVVVVVVVIVIAPSTETIRMLQRVLSPRPMRVRGMLLWLL